MKAPLMLEEWIREDMRRLGIGYRAVEEAPSTLQGLREAVGDPRTWAEGLEVVIPVWSGKSDRTIWSSPDMNHAFRAWHDYHHLILGEEMDHAGEVACALHALDELRNAALPDGDRLGDILWAELWGQALHFERFGVFPEDQAGFVGTFVGSDSIRKTMEAGPW